MLKKIFFHDVEKNFFSWCWKKVFSMMLKKKDKKWKWCIFSDLTFHNVVTIEQRYMFNTHFQLKVRSLNLVWNSFFWAPLALECYTSLRRASPCFALLRLAALGLRNLLRSACSASLCITFQSSWGSKKKNFTLDKKDPTFCCQWYWTMVLCLTVCTINYGISLVEGEI